MTTTDLLTVAEAAAHYKVSEKTIRRWIAAGRIKAVRPGERTIRVIVDKAVA
ncbi:MAG: helix-turn-helix domain-containing protein [Propionibacteriaceae bacterium]|nr:helix-turn-helix domain-containing protein [Propionibacteriaceae bacterium]